MSGVAGLSKSLCSVGGAVTLQGWLSGSQCRQRGDGSSSSVARGVLSGGSAGHEGAMQ